MSNQRKAVILFNQDLRISDNNALFNCLNENSEILAIYILDEKNRRKLGGANKWFLHHSLQKLSKELSENYNINLNFFSGNSLEIISKIFQSKKISNFYLNIEIEPDHEILQNKISKICEKNNVNFHSFHSYLLFENNKIKNGQGQYFKVFTPFWKNCLKNIDKIKKPIPKFNKKKFQNIKLDFLNNKIEKLNLLPKINWDKEFYKIWKFDDKEIRLDFENFLKNDIRNYDKNRNLPALNKTSKLSPYLHFGIFSIRGIFFKALKENDIFAIENSGKENNGIKTFLSEIGWREFSHNLLYNFKDLANKNFKSEFDKFPWQKNEDFFNKWKQGQTGYPIVDAGMRELWKTGYMHNRVRMITASFLIKDLLIDWRQGEKWFWNCLVDANLAANSANWQWVAGSGADASPYFRVFNPILQGEKFDKNGDYIRKWIPELKNLPNKIIHKPWEASKEILKEAKIELGKTYPNKIVNHDEARNEALRLYKNLKNL